MSHSIKQFEYSTEATFEEHGLRKFEEHLRSVEVWGRRCLQTSSKLQSAISFLNYQINSVPELEAYALMIRDFEHIAALVTTYGRRLEIMVPAVTSVLQIADTRRSLKEAANVTRLTYLELLFVPLSFVASLFSMNGGVSAHDLAIYFAVALPLYAMVFSVTRLPKFDFAPLGQALGKLGNWMRKKCFDGE